MHFHTDFKSRQPNSRKRQYGYSELHSPQDEISHFTHAPNPYNYPGCVWADSSNSGWHPSARSESAPVPLFLAPPTLTLPSPPPPLPSPLSARGRPPVSPVVRSLEPPADESRQGRSATGAGAHGQTISHGRQVRAGRERRRTERGRGRREGETEDAGPPVTPISGLSAVT